MIQKTFYSIGGDNIVHRHDTLLDAQEFAKEALADAFDGDEWASWAEDIEYGELEPHGCVKLVNHRRDPESGEEYADYKLVPVKQSSTSQPPPTGSGELDRTIEPLLFEFVFKAQKLLAEREYELRPEVSALYFRIVAQFEHDDPRKAMISGIYHRVLNMPQPLPTGSGELVTPSLLALLADHPDLHALVSARDAFGRQKYGTGLRIHNGRDPIEDANQEIGDLLQYLQQARMEGRDITTLLDMMARAITVFQEGGK
jgi:hypothetical protein